MKHKNLIRAVVLAAVFAWPAVETYNLFRARQAVTQSEQLLASVRENLAKSQARLNQSQPASLRVSK